MLIWFDRYVTNWIHISVSFVFRMRWNGCERHQTRSYCVLSQQLLSKTQRNDHCIEWDCRCLQESARLRGLKSRALLSSANGMECAEQCPRCPGGIPLSFGTVGVCARQNSGFKLASYKDEVQGICRGWANRRNRFTPSCEIATSC